MHRVYPAKHPVRPRRRCFSNPRADAATSMRLKSPTPVSHPASQLGPSPPQEKCMKLTHWYFAALAPIAALGCMGTAVGHLAVLAVTFGIFFGTLSLGRARPLANLDTPAAAATSAKL